MDFTFLLNILRRRIKLILGVMAELLSPTGRTVFEQPFIGAAHTVNAAGIPPGIYFVRVEYPGGFATEKAFIH